MRCSGHGGERHGCLVILNPNVVLAADALFQLGQRDRFQVWRMTDNLALGNTAINDVFYCDATICDSTNDVVIFAMTGNHQVDFFQPASTRQLWLVASRCIGEQMLSLHAFFDLFVAAHGSLLNRFYRRQSGRGTTLGNNLFSLLGNRAFRVRRRGVDDSHFVRNMLDLLKRIVYGAMQLGDDGRSDVSGAGHVSPLRCFERYDGSMQFDMIASIFCALHFRRDGVRVCSCAVENVACPFCVSLRLHSFCKVAALFVNGLRRLGVVLGKMLLDRIGVDEGEPRMRQKLLLRVKRLSAVVVPDSMRQIMLMPWNSEVVKLSNFGKCNFRYRFPCGSIKA